MCKKKGGLKTEKETISKKAGIFVRSWGSGNKHLEVLALFFACFFSLLGCQKLE